MSEGMIDLVVSYTVHSGGVEKDGYEAVSHALNNGFRILDVIQTASTVGGGGTALGHTCVTVVMTKNADTSGYYHMKKGK